MEDSQKLLMENDPADSTRKAVAQSDNRALNNKGIKDFRTLSRKIESRRGKFEKQCSGSRVRLLKETSLPNNRCHKDI